MVTISSYSECKYIFSIEKVCGNCRYYVQHYREAEKGICIPIFCGHCILKNGTVKKTSGTCKSFSMKGEEENV